VIGGSGFYRFLPGLQEVVVHTPYGAPSAPVAVGEVSGRRVAFLPRHGTRHEVPPHRVNYRANIWALRELGVHRVFGPCAAGSLSPDIHPGDLVVLDQLIDRTSGRSDTFLDGPVVGHVGFADPYCPELAAVLLATAGGNGGPRVHRGGTVVVVQGPRFSTRAESRWFRAAGWQVVNMTQYPEAYLARELGLCYSGIAQITDYDTGAAPDGSGEPVTMQAVLQVLDRCVADTRALLMAAIASLPETPACACAEGADPGPFRR
jgi:5'-methylthioadenosine phosphorylase